MNDVICWDVSENLCSTTFPPNSIELIISSAVPVMVIVDPIFDGMTLGCTEIVFERIDNCIMFEAFTPLNDKYKEQFPGCIKEINMQDA
jgi:hypothetical protein